MNQYPSDEQTIVQPENAVPQMWEPETPFLSDPFPRENPSVSAATAFGPSFELESPFTSEYALEGENIPSPQAEQYARLLGELYDTEFEEALTDLVNEAAALAEDRQMYESEDPARESADVERTLREYLQPIEREATAMFDRMIDAVGERDINSMSEAEIDALFERFEPSVSLPSPVMEDFVKKLGNKARKAFKAVNTIAGKLNPANLVLRKLNKFPALILNRVLKFAINKIPAKLRPAAKQLAKRFLGVSAEAESLDEFEVDGVREEYATADPAEIQEEMDSRFAGSILKGEDFDRQVDEVQFAEAQVVGTGDPLQELERARRRFAKAVVNLPAGQDPTPVVEQFIPVILAAARIAIKIIGRPRVVNFLAGLVAKLITKYIGKESAIALSRALVDTGLKLVSLESTPESEQLAAGNTIASTVEDTINRLVTDAPAEAWENEGLLEAYTLEAFEKSAAANFPDSTIKPDVRETAEKSGAWVLHKRYKKYTRVIDVCFTPQMKQWIKSFYGVRLSSIMQNRLGVALDKPVCTRVHLFEAIRGTTLSHIASQEKGLPGLGQAGRSSWTLIHPLTPCVAGLMFQEPGLGRDVSGRFLSNRNTIAIGQRFYFIEIPGVSPRPLPPIQRRTSTGAITSTGVGGRQSQTRLILDFPRGQIRLFIYYGDADAQKLKELLRTKSPGAISALLTPGLDVSLRTIFSGNAPKQLQVIHEAVPTQQAIPSMVLMVLRIAGEKIVEWLVEWALKALRAEIEKKYDQFVERFRKAADDPADGVTIRIIFQGPPFFESLRKLFTSTSAGVPGGILDIFRGRGGAASVSIETLPGLPN